MQSTAFKFSDGALLSCSFFLHFQLFELQTTAPTRDLIFKPICTRSSEKKLQEAVTKCRQSWMKKEPLKGP